MIVTEARKIANLKNARLSKGPVSERGKAQSRKNSLKHGLTGAGVVIADQDAAEIDRRDDSFKVELNVQSEVGRICTQQMAILSVRMERLARQETAAVAERVRHASEDFDQARLDEADRLLDILGEDPRIHLRQLKTSPEGVDALIAAWQDLKVDLTRDLPVWTEWHRERAENLTGSRIEAASGSRIGALSRAILGDLSGLGAEDGGELDEADRKVWAQILLAERIDSEIASLEANYETLDFATIEADRREAPTRALFDPSKEATLARRYESEARRGFFKAMKDLQRVEKEFVERPTPVATPDSAITSEPMGSFREKTPTPREPRPTPPQSARPMSDPRPKTSENRTEMVDRPPIRKV